MLPYFVQNAPRALLVILKEPVVRIIVNYAPWGSIVKKKGPLYVIGVIMGKFNNK